MRALGDGGILSVTLWNKEEPPKSVLKLYATMAAAAREVDGGEIADRFFVAASYLSTATVLYKRGGFTAEEVDTLREHTRAMSFDEIYSPGFEYDPAQTANVLEDYRRQIFDADAAADPVGDAKDGPRTSPSMSRRGGRNRRKCRPRIGRQRRRGAGDGHGPTGLASPRARRLGRDRRALPVRHAPAHQQAAVLRRLCQTRRPAARHRSARAAAGRVGLSPLVGDARHRLPRRAVAHSHSARVRLAHHLQPQSRQVPHHRLFRLPGRRLHHGGSGPDFRFHAGA